MLPRNKQDGLAFVIKAASQENIGKIVTCTKLLGYYKKGDTIQSIYDDNELFLNVSFSDFIWEVTSPRKNLKVKDNYYFTALCPDSNLSPIEPLDENENAEVEMNKELTTI
jgi:hypothetical protein